jgi:hypothetical protein
MVKIYLTRCSIEQEASNDWSSIGGRFLLLFVQQKNDPRRNCSRPEGKEYQCLNFMNISRRDAIQQSRSSRSRSRSWSWSQSCISRKRKFTDIWSIWSTEW